MKTDDLDKCPGCGWSYEVGTLSPMFGSGGRTLGICAPCALQEMSKRHGAKLTHFGGETAQDMLEDALDWRAEHPECAPVTAAGRGKHE